MSDDALPGRLLRLSHQLRDLAHEYRELKFDAGEEAMRWPLAIVAEDDGSVGVWCAKDGCLLDGHSSQIYLDTPDNFTMVQVLYALIGHIEANREREDDL